MASNLSLRSLLDSEKLTGLNFDNWYQKLKLVLEHERILYMIMDLAPEEPAPNAWEMVWDTYLKWLNDHTMICFIMRVSMNDEFSQKFEEAQSKKMLQVLKNSFDTFDDIERYKTSCTIFNTRMREGTSITDHVLYMIKQIKKLNKLSFPLHEQLGKDEILNSLPKSYLLFLNHFWMMKPIVNYHDLLGLLQTFEKDHQLHKEMVNIVGGVENCILKSIMWRLSLSLYMNYW